MMELIERTECQKLLIQSTTRIYSSNGTFIGTGFFILPNVLASCRHVFYDDKNKKFTNKIFKIEGLNFSITLTKENTFFEEGLDLICIDLVHSIREVCIPLEIAKAKVGNKLWGYSYNKDYDATAITSKLIEESIYDNKPVFRIEDDAIERGSSGTPLWDETENSLLGVVFRLKSQKQNALVIPTQNFKEYFPKFYEENLKYHLENPYWKEAIDIKSTNIQTADKKITINQLKENFEIDKSGWLKERYTPRLHHKNKIQEEIEGLLFSDGYRQEEIKRIEENISLIARTTELIDKFLKLTDNHLLDEDLNAYSQNIQLFKIQFQRIINFLNQGEDTFSCKAIEEIEGYKLSLSLKDLPVTNVLKQDKQDLIHLIQKVHRLNLEKYIQELPEYFKPHNKIFFGAAGSGKTHALANAVEVRLQNNLPAIIIEAKSVNPNGWINIFQDGLKLANNLSLLEISIALNILASESNDKKILICIDGLDEVPFSAYLTWKTRINELENWLQRYPNIRFAISCRHYIPVNMNPLQLDFVDRGIGNRSISLYDADNEFLEQLIPIYFKEYNIKIDEAPWLIDSFQSPLELKLFCEFYNGKPITSNAKTHLNALVKEKINRVEGEVLAKYPSDISSQQDQITLKILIRIANIFYDKSFFSFIERDEFLELVLDEKLSNILNRDKLSHIIDFFCKAGLLSEYHRQSSYDLSPDTYKYRITYQSILEVVIAIQYVQNAIKKKDFSLPIYLNENILKFTAISFLTDERILIGENGIWVNEFEEDKIFIFQLQAINQAGNSIVAQYKDWIKQRFLSSNKERYLIMEYIIIPNARNPHYPINPLWLHNILINIANVFERDLIWSGEDYPAESYQSRQGNLLLRYYHEYMEQNNQELFGYTLNKNDKFDGLPLVLAWSLTSIENNYREFCRAELSYWGSLSIEEFIKLLDLVFVTNDPQMKDDLINIAMGVALLIEEPKSLKLLKGWMFKHILNGQSLAIYRSVIIRHSARMIIERAFKFGVVTEKELKQARSPYNLPFKLLHNLKLEVLDNLSFDGVHPIKHDLYWKIIDKVYENFIPPKFKHEKYSKEIESFFQEYQKYHGKHLGNHGLTVSAIVGFIYDLGYNRTSSAWTEGKQGSKSKIATFEEKYVWSAVYYLIGYFSDYLPLKSDNVSNNVKIELNFANNYQSLIQIPNPVHSFKIKDIEVNNRWLIPTELSNKLDKDISNDILINTVHNLDFNTFKEWLFFSKNDLKQIIDNSMNCVVLYNFTRLESPNKFIQTHINITSGFVKNDVLDLFFDNLDFCFNSVHSSPNDLRGIPNTQSYISPKEVVENNEIEEIENIFQYEIDNKKIEIIFGVIRVVYNDNVNGEKEFHVPSKFIRQLLEIEKGDGKVFISKSNELVSFVNERSENFDNHQNVLLIDRKKLEEKLDKLGWIQFWFIEIYKQINPKKIEELGIYERHKKTYIAWKKGQEIQVKNILNDDFKRSPQEDNVSKIDIDTFLQTSGMHQDDFENWNERIIPVPLPYLKSEVTFDDFLKLDMRVGRITEVQEIEISESAFKVKVDLGFSQKYTVLGLMPKWQIENFIGKNIVVIVNIKNKTSFDIPLECYIPQIKVDTEFHFMEISEEMEVGSVVR